LKPIKNIQERLGALSLKSKKKKLTRQVKSFNIEKASVIGVLYDATNRNDYELAKKLVQYFKEERKDVMSLGYINSKKSSELVTSQLNFSFFDNNHLSRMMIPKGSEVENFIQTSYSILIDLNIKSSFPIEYICSLSKAKFKVGAKGNYRDEVCDMIIDIEKDKRIEFLIIQIKHYLKMINP